MEFDQDAESDTSHSSGSPFDPIRFRAAASDAWAEAVNSFDPGRNATMPTYWADRVGYRIFREPRGTAGHDLLCDLIPFRYKSSEFDTNLPGWLYSPDIVGNHFPASVYRPFAPSDRLRGWVGDWVSHLDEYGIDVRGQFQVPEFTTIIDIYRHSVYHPGPPAINGPGFVEYLAPQQVDQLINSVGPSAIVDFSLALEWIHEGSHFIQIGDPLLAELAWSYLWVEFIKKSDLTIYQQNVKTGRWCTIEAPYIAQLPLTSMEIGTLFRDTFEGTLLITDGDRGSYTELCDLTSQLDRRQISYATYLDQAVRILSKGKQKEDGP